MWLKLERMKIARAVMLGIKRDIASLDKEPSDLQLIKIIQAHMMKLVNMTDLKSVA